MATIIGSPSRYIQGKNELTKLHEHLSALAKKGVYAIVDSFVLDSYSKEIGKSFQGRELPLHLGRFGGESSRKEINRILKEIEKTGADAVAGLGGGKTLDTAKAAAHYAGLPVIICPTIASTDAPCSALSVIYTDDGQFEQYLPLPQNPNIVLVDTEIIAKAPVKLLAAGMGDALATYFEARACVASGAVHMLGGTATNAAFSLSKRCFEILLEDGYKAKMAVQRQVITKSVENIIEANTYLSGIGFESCGLAAAHAVHNGLTALPETHERAHGEKVAFGTLVQLVLENAPQQELGVVLNFCRTIGLPVTLADLGVTDVTADKIMAVAKLACAENDTMGNMPFPVTAEDVCAAILVADEYGSVK